MYYGRLKGKVPFFVALPCRRLRLPPVCFQSLARCETCWASETACFLPDLVQTGKLFRLFQAGPRKVVRGGPRRAVGDWKRSGTVARIVATFQSSSVMPPSDRA